MIVNKITFADMAGVGKASVTLSVQRGKLIETQDGYIDTENQTNATYLANRRKKAKPEDQNKPLKKPRRKKEKPASTTTIEALDGVDLPVDDLTEDESMIAASESDSPDMITKLAVEIRLKKAQARRHELKYEHDKGLLCPVELVERAAAKVGSEMKIRLQDLPRRITPRILAMARSGAEAQEIQETLEREIDDGIEAISQTLGAKIV